MNSGGNARAWSFPLAAPVAKVVNAGVRTFQKHPFLIKTLSSGVGFAVGDSLTQMATRRTGEPYDWPRTAAMGAAGLSVAGPLGFLLIVWMEAHIMPHSPTCRLAISTKVTLDQILGGILWQAALLAINEPYRKAALDLAGRVKADVRKRMRAPSPAAAAAVAR